MPDQPASPADGGANTAHFLTVKEAAVFEQVSERIVQKRVAGDEYDTAESLGSGGRDGNTCFLIDPLSLSPAGQLRYLQKNFPEQVGNGSLDGIDNETAERLFLLRDAIERLNRAERGSGEEIVKEICAEAELSRSSLYRLRKAYNETGSLEALLRKTRSDINDSRAFNREALEIGVAEYLLSRNKLNTYTKLKAEALMNGWDYGSYRAFCSIINRLVDQDQALSIYAARGRKGLENQAVPSILRDNSDLLPNEYFCGDHHQFDLFVFDERMGKVYRPWLTAWQDMRTRAIVGYMVCVQPNSRTIAQALQHALDHQEQDGRPKLRHYGVPKNVYIDNGKDYRSYYISGGRWTCKRFMAPEYDTKSRAVLAELHAEPIFALPFKARSKPIERWFNTLEHQSIEHLPGFCGHNTEQRRQFVDYELMQQIKNQQLLTLRDFKVLLRQYLDEYHDTPHRGRDMKGRSPNEVWDLHHQQGWAPTTIGDKGILNLLFMRSTDRIVSRHGIQIHNEFYYHEALLFHVGHKVEVRWDPDDLCQVHVFQDDRFICTATGFKYSSMKTPHDELGERIREQRRMVKQVENRYAYLTGGVIKPDNTGSPGTWGKAIREKYGDAADEQDRRRENRQARQPQNIPDDILLEPPDGYFDEDFDSDEDLVLIPIKPNKLEG